MIRASLVAFSLLLAAIPGILSAQQTLGGITGVVTDSTGSLAPGIVVNVKNVDTNLELKTVTSNNGTYQVLNLPVGNYSVSFSKDGFKTETHTAILVQGDRVTTVNGKLEVGTVATSVEVTATPLLNQVDTTSGYVLDAQTINNTPLGTGQLHAASHLEPRAERRLHEYLRLQCRIRQPGHLGQRPARHQQQLLHQWRHRGQRVQRQILQPGGIVAIHAEYRPIQRRRRRYPDQYFGLRFGGPGHRHPARGSHAGTARECRHVRRIPGFQVRRSHRSHHALGHQPVPRRRL